MPNGKCKMQKCVCTSCRSREMLKNTATHFVAKIGVDTAENEPSKVCRYIHTPPTPGHKLSSENAASRPIFRPCSELSFDELTRFVSCKCVCSCRTLIRSERLCASKDARSPASFSSHALPYACKRLQMLNKNRQKNARFVPNVSSEKLEVSCGAPSSHRCSCW